MTRGRFLHEIGVPIPDNLAPEDWAIYWLCAPSDYQWSSAIRTAVRMLSRGRFWKRDDRERSIKGAQEIGRAIEMSIGQCDMSDIGDAIRYLADNLSLSVNQNQSQSCGGNGGNGGSDIVAPPPGYTETDEYDIFPELPASELLPENELNSEYLCAVSHYLADSWRDSWSELDDTWDLVGAGAEAIVVWLQERFPAGAVVPFAGMLISQAVILLEVILLGRLLDKVADRAALQRDDLQQAIYNATSPIEAKRAFESVIAESRHLDGNLPYAMAHAIAQMLDWDKIIGGDVIVPASYYEIGCSQYTPAYPGFSWVEVTFPPATKMPCDTITALPTSSGNQNGMVIERLADIAGNSYVGWSITPPPSCIGISFQFGAQVEYTGHSTNEQGFAGWDGSTCHYPGGYQASRNNLIFLHRTNAPDVSLTPAQVDDLVRDELGHVSRVELDNAFWHSVGFFRSMALGHSWIIEISSIRYLVED